MGAQFFFTDKSSQDIQKIFKKCDVQDFLVKMKKAGISQMKK